jgi:nucleoside phosphorylase
MLNENIAAVDMESYGLYYAAHNALVVKPQVVCIKGVSDLCDARKNDKLHDAASYASAAVAHDLILKWKYK